MLQNIERNSLMSKQVTITQYMMPITVIVSPIDTGVWEITQIINPIQAVVFSYLVGRSICLS